MMRGPRRVWRNVVGPDAAAIVACVVIGLALSACGGSNTATGKAPRTAKAAYIAKADAICSAEGKQMVKVTMLAPQVTESSTAIQTNIPGILRRFDRLLAIERPFAKELARIPIPAAARNQIDQIRSTDQTAGRRLRTILVLLSRIPTRIPLDDVNGFRKTFRELAVVGSQIRRLSTRNQQLSKQFGFKACGTQVHFREIGGLPVAAPMV